MDIKDITKRDDNFSQWYTDIVRVADLVDYSGVKGSMIIRPLGYAIWEEMQCVLDQMFKETNHENVMMPMFIPESLLNVEKEHVEGFAPEVAWVTHGGDNLLEERMCVRPTSEVLFCEHYKKIIKSYRDLPKLYNQWCTIVRWEKTTRPFLRSREILWQEGHTMHENKECAMEETLKMLKVYEKFQKEYLAIPVITGKKTNLEKFAGAEITYTVEAMMYDGIALQNGTSHYFGTNFSEVFDIKYLNKENKLVHPHQTSWGVTTRMIGSLIMVHSDDFGLVLPPKIAPIKVSVIPIGDVDEELILLEQKLKEANLTYFVDKTNKSVGFKFSESDVKGYPIRIEFGKRDLDKGLVTLVRRDTIEKIHVKYENIIEEINKLLIEIQNNLYNKAKVRRNEMLYETKDYNEFKTIAKTKNGFIKVNWCGQDECELKIKEETNLKSRCIIEEKVDGPCIVCNKEGKHKIYFGKQY